MTALQAANWITEHVLPESMQVAAGVWDRGTNYMHDTDGAIGLRVRNLKGESWITYGDKQFFAEPNRINRLKRYVVQYTVSFRTKLVWCKTPSLISRL